MLKTPSSTVIGGAFWTPDAVMLGSDQSFDQIMKRLFANGEQGAYIDFNDLSVMFQDAAGTIPVTGVGQPIGLIRDKSGRNNHAYQTASSMRPTLQRNAITGANYLSFDGTDDFLQTNSIDFTATDKVSMFAGVRKLSDATRGIVVHTGSIMPVPNTIGNFSLEAPSFELKGYSATLPSNNGNWDGKSLQLAPHSAVLTAHLWQSAPNKDLGIRFRVNSIIEPTSGGQLTLPGNFGNLPMYVGRRGGAALPFNGYIYGLIVLGRSATDAETAAIEKEFAKRMGVTLSV